METRKIIGGKYELTKHVGTNRYGEIYIARREGSADLFRVTLMSNLEDSDEESMSRFIQEIELLTTLRHVNLWCAVDSGRDRSTYFFVTPFEPSISFDEYLEREKTLTERRTLTYLIAIAEVLKYIWDEKKLVHRNIKPQNLYITEKNEVKLTGFDIAKATSDNGVGLTGVGYTLGTPEYMSPEQVRAKDKLDFRSDMYSLGIVMYQALIGEPPFMDNAPILLMRKQCEEPQIPLIERNAGISREFSDMIDIMMAKDPADRYQSWEQVVMTAKKILQAPPKAAISSVSVSPFGRIIQWIVTIDESPTKIALVISIGVNFLLFALLVLAITR